MRSISFLLLAGLLAACQTSGGNVNDPSPNATLSDNTAEPTDGLENETGVE